jgi:hypothetical protein
VHSLWRGETRERLPRQKEGGWVHPELPKLPESACFSCWPYLPLCKMFNADQLKYSRSRGVTQTLRDVAVCPSSPDRPAKRTDQEAGLSPRQKISETRPSSSKSSWGRHTARKSSFEDSINQPRVVLGTPLPPTQQSSGLFRALAPSPPVRRTTHPFVSQSEAATTRGSTASVDHAYLATRYHKGGKDSQDNPSTAEARVKRAAIQRDHRSRRRAGETVSLTPTISQLGNFQGSEVAGEGIYLCAVAGSRFFGLTMEHRCESRWTTDGWV